MRGRLLVFAILLIMIMLSGCVQEAEQQNIEIPLERQMAGQANQASEKPVDFPKIASWLAKKDEIIDSGKPFDLVMTAWVTPEEASGIRKILAGLTVNWILDNEGWKTFLETVSGNEIKEGMYLKNPNGTKCAFGWESEEWAHEEIYAMDPSSPEWKELILSFYKNVLDQPQHDGIIVDMVVEKQWWCPEAITDEEWEEATKEIFAELNEMNTEDKLIILA